MKKVFASCFLLFLFSQNLTAQTVQNKEIRHSALGVSFILNDFTTAQRIRSGSIEQVFRDKKVAKFREMSPGIGLTYFKGLQKHVDFAGTLAASLVNYPFPNRTAFANDGLLMEADASVNLKMFSEAYWFTPYLSVGVGGSMYKNYYGAFIPLGAGLKVNLFDEASLFVNANYKVPVTAETANYHFTYSFGIAGIIGKK